MEWRDASGSLLLVDCVLPERLAGRRLADLEVDGKIRLVAVTRAGVPRLDAPALIGQEGDLLHIVVAKDELKTLDELLSANAVDSALRRSSVESRLRA